MGFGRPTTLPIDPWGTPDRGYATMRVTSPYGPRDTGLFADFHAGLDIGNARLGDEVIAIEAGTVVNASIQPAPPWNYPSPTTKLAAWGPSYGGNVVVIEHEGGKYSQYAHLRDMTVTKGQRISRGQLVGHIGDSGSAAPPPAGGGGHLHFGIRDLAALSNGHNGWVDPWPLINPTLPDTAAEDDMPPILRRIVGQKLVCPKGTEFRRKPAFADPVYYTAPAQIDVLAFAVIEGEPYRTGVTSTSNEWAAYVAIAGFIGYVPLINGTLVPICEDLATANKLERATDAVKAARRAVTAAINVLEG